MNKLMVAIIALFTISPVLGMELMTITEKEKEAFSQHLAMAVGFGTGMDIGGIHYKIDYAFTKDFTAYDPLNELKHFISVSIQSIAKAVSKIRKIKYFLSDKIRRFYELKEDYPQLQKTKLKPLKNRISVNLKKISSFSKDSTLSSMQKKCNIIGYLNIIIFIKLSILLFSSS